MRMRFPVFVLMIFCAGLLFKQALALPNPTEQFKPTLESLLGILVDPDLKGDSKKTIRRQKIIRTIRKSFDFREMSKGVLGEIWLQINDVERDHFTSLMTDYMENVYIGKLGSYSEMQLEFTGEKVRGPQAIVSTFVTNDGAQIPVHYRMKLNDAQWMVYDIKIGTFTLIKNFKKQFKYIVGREKFEGLVKYIEEKNKSF